jgi:hypothetical protein
LLLRFSRSPAVPWVSRSFLPGEGQAVAASMLGIDPDHRVYAITRIADDTAGRTVEVNTIVMPTHQWTLRYTWPAEQPTS